MVSCPNRSSCAPWPGLQVTVYGLGLYSRSQKVGTWALGGLVLGSLILYLKGMRIMMFQLSGFYYKDGKLSFGFLQRVPLRSPLKASFEA